MSSTPRGRWLALVAALLGWMFDGLEMGLFPLVARPALRELAPGAAEADIGHWYGIITAGFLVGAATGGVLFGWLGDKLGRVRAMMLSVALYAGCSGACAFAASPVQLALLRFLGALGMGGEWALGVALVMELWPDTSRGWLAGCIGACGNLGYCLVGGLALLLNHCGEEISESLGTLGIPIQIVVKLTAYGNWRLLMLIGVLPAALTMFIRFFVPESERWQQRQATEPVSHWAGRDLLAVLLGAAVAGGIIAVWAVDCSLLARMTTTSIGMVVVTACFLVPTRQYLLRSQVSAAARRHILGRMLLAALLSGVPLLGTWAGFMWVYTWVDANVGSSQPDARPTTQIASAFGAALGSGLGAWCAGRFGRKLVYAGMCLLSALSLFAFFRLNHEFGTLFVLSAFAVGGITSAFYGWLPLYLPELFPTAVRASGQGFGFNFGRIIAAVGVLQVRTLMTAFDNDYAKACSMVAAVYLAGLVVIAFAPETRGRALLDQCDD